MSEQVLGLIAAGEPAVPPAEVINRFTGLDIVVIGDALLDEWFSGTSRRLCREAPVPVVEVTGVQAAPGAGANTAVNLAALGGRVRYFGLVGDDGPGLRLRQEFRRRGIDDWGLLVDPGRNTTVKRRVTTKDQVVARFDLRDSRPWTQRAVERLAELVADAVGDADAVIVCDYDDGLTSGAVRKALREVRGRMTCPLVVDAHSVLAWGACRPTAVTPSLAEVLDIVGSPHQAGQQRLMGPLLLRRTNASMVVTTMDSEGAVLYLPEGKEHRTFASRPAQPGRTIGAGDTFTAAFGMALAAGFAPGTAADLGQLAADVVVTKAGTAVCTIAELSNRVH